MATIPKQKLHWSIVSVMQSIGMHVCPWEGAGENGGQKELSLKGGCRMHEGRTVSGQKRACKGHAGQSTQLKAR